MTNQIAELRNEAYKLWGLKKSNVIYNILNDHMTFKLDLNENNKKWPKSYSIAISDCKTINRVIMPILIYKEKELLVPAYYDMSESMNEAIVDLVENNPPKKQLNKFNKTLNYILPKKWQFKEDILPENYIFYVELQKDKLIVTLN